MGWPPTYPPMLASSGRPPKGAGFVIEPKWDGCRSIVTVHDGKIRGVRSRNGHDVTDCYPELAPAPASVSKLSAVFDGEIVALGPNGLPDFQRLQQRMNRHKPGPVAVATVPLVFVVFDLLWLNGKDFTGQPLSVRRRELERFPMGGSWQLTPRLDVELDDALIDSFRDAGIEGVMVKAAESLYRPGERSKHWVKFKARQVSLAVIGGYLAERSRSRIGSLALGMHGPAGFHYVGQIANSLPHVHADQLDRFLRSTVVDRSHFVDLKSRSLIYVEPHAVVEVAYTEVTAAGTFRQPILRRVVLDAQPHEITMNETFMKAIQRRPAVSVGSGQRL